MKKLFILLLLLSSPVYAQTAEQVAPGYMTVNGCPSSPITPCYKSSTTPVNSATGESHHVFLAKAGTLYGFSVTSGASAGYVLVYNSASAPADGTVTPIGCYALPASSTLGVAYTPLPLTMSTGITLVFSTSGCFTQTSSATAFFLGEVL